MIGAYCVSYTMQPRGVAGASCASSKADIVITCMKR